MQHPNTNLHRRCFLRRSSIGLGSVALQQLLSPWKTSAQLRADGHETWAGTVNPLHSHPKAKRVIYLCMAGGPSHLETLDYKPKLAEMDGKPMPESITAGQPIAQLQGQTLKCLAPQHPFSQLDKVSKAFVHSLATSAGWLTIYALFALSTPSKSTMILLTPL